MDVIGDMLTRIRNALAVKKAEVVLPYSKFKENLAQLLKTQGFVADWEIVPTEKTKDLKLKLSYLESGEPAILGLRRISKPGQRIYAKSEKIPWVTVGLGATIVSTSKGLKTDAEARKEKLGGEVICQIW